MSKQEFLQGLRAALEGEVSPSAIQENTRYYDGYIESEVRAGKREEDVIEEIGDPRLIARTIIDTTPGAGGGDFETQEDLYRDDYTGSSREGAYSDRNQGAFRYYNLNKWYVKLIVVLILIFVFWLAFTIIGGVLALLMPLLPVFALIMFVVWLIRGSGR